MGACGSVAGESNFNRVHLSSFDADTVISDANQVNSPVRRLTQNVIRVNREQAISEYYDVDTKSVLGKGLNGEIFLCIHKATKLRYALKTLSKDDITDDQLALFRNELSCMAQLDHPNILRVHEVFETENSICLVMELCKGGHLMDRLTSQTGSYYREKVACRYVHTILQAIAYCHANNVVHRDLKLENILFETEEHDSDLKIIDFGLSSFFAARVKLQGHVGTCDYVAPEVLEGNYDSKCDVWSIGVIAYILLSGSAPFYGATEAELLASVRAAQWHFDDHLLHRVSPEARDFITKCLTKRPFWRPTAAAALKHPWFNLLTSSKSQKLPSPAFLHRFGVFIVRTWLAKIFIEVVAHTVLPEMTVELRAQFNRFDVSQTGEITMSDLRSIMKHFNGLTNEFLSVILANVDVNQTGKISYHEFLAATMNRKHFTEQNLQVAFELISGHKAYITSADIKALVGDAKYDVDKLLAEVGMGLTAESQISFDQFMAILNGHDEAHGFLNEYRDE